MFGTGCNGFQLSFIISSSVFSTVDLQCMWLVRVEIGRSLVGEF